MSFPEIMILNILTIITKQKFEGIGTDICRMNYFQRNEKSKRRILFSRFNVENGCFQNILFGCFYPFIADSSFVLLFRIS